MTKTAARFTQAELSRAVKAAKANDCQVEIQGDTLRIIPQAQVDTEEKARPLLVEPQL